MFRPTIVFNLFNGNKIELFKITKLVKKLSIKLSPKTHKTPYFSLFTL